MWSTLFFNHSDDASRGVGVYLMKDKGEAGHFLGEFIIMAKNHLEKQ